MTWPDVSGTDQAFVRTAIKNMQRNTASCYTIFQTNEVLFHFFT